MESLNYYTEHIDFDWKIDFDKNMIDGRVYLNLKNNLKDQSDLILNEKYLNIKEVFVQGKTVEFKSNRASKVEALGNLLTIPVESLDDIINVKIEYSTTLKCTALQWMQPQTTAGKKYPYLFSQCQAIHARSLYPCQDQPNVKFTYSATVEAVSSLDVLMSAIKTDKQTDNENTIHKFVQRIPIPSYLVAIISGNIVGKKVGPRSTIWTEPEMIDKCALEFSDTEQFISIAEKLCGPYVWGIYDIVVLPPSFPYGGMENPCLTFVTPTLVVGDKSLVSVIAHEISHSWTGNLVTNATWEDFWLNEGHTRYLERLIMEEYHNQSEPMRHFLIESGLACLQESLNNYGKDHPFNQMVPPLKDCDPDDSFSRVPYEKGSNLLFYLETVCGKDKMLSWLPAYLKTYQYKSLTTAEWKDYLYQYMTETEKLDKSLLDKVDWDAWFYGRWTIPVKHSLDRTLAAKCEELAEKWLQMDKRPSDIEMKEYSKQYDSLLTEQKYFFLQYLNDFKEAVLPHEVFVALGEAHGYFNSTNSEILYGWSLLIIRSNVTPYAYQVIDFVNSQGRLKYTKTIYSAYYKWNDIFQKEIVANFEAQEPFMHPITSSELRKILKL